MDTIQILMNFETREDAKSYLKSYFPKKKNLEIIANNIDLPLFRQDKVEVLRDKIVEATVGAKLRSKAIRG